MMRILRIASCLIFVQFAASCSGQSQASPWSKIESAEAGFEILFPCQPEISKKLFQKEPKEANAYSYQCEFEGISFSVSLPERFEDFDPSKIEEQLDGIEEVLRMSIGSNAAVKTTNLRISDYLAREFEADGSGVYGLQLNIAHPRGIYGVQAFGKYDGSSTRAKVADSARKFVSSFKLRKAR
jgi:hypothetical protein